ncbi:NF-kappa-B inhibitor-like protein 2 [Sarotherodon galilaeus]
MMAEPVKLRIILGSNNTEKLTIASGMPKSVEDLSDEIKRQFDIQGDIRLQYMDSDFDNEFINLKRMDDIQDKSTVKVIRLTDASDFGEVGMNQKETSLSSSDTLLLSSSDSETARSQWPAEFQMPKFPYDVEMQLQSANQAFISNGILLNPGHKLKSDILEALAEKMMTFKAYPSNLEIESVAEALIKAHPCLREQGSFSGFYGWKISLKYKMANYRTKLRNLGCPELSINSLKHKPTDQCHPAYAVKKPRKAEVNFCPPYPAGETQDSLESERLALLTEVKKKHNEIVIKEKMARTFAYRRQELVKSNPMIADFKIRWPGLFSVAEVEAELLRITTAPLVPRFLAQLDQYTDQLIKVFKKKGGAAGRKMRQILAPATQNETIEKRRECVLRALPFYLNEDPSILFKEYLDSDATAVQRELEQITLGIFTISVEGGDASTPPADVGITIEGVEVLHDLGDMASACALLMGVIYALNLSYPRELKAFFEVLQKLFLHLDASRLSTKVQMLKNKLYE